jgi:MFS family permease
MWAAVISICICVGSIIGALVLSFKKQMDKVSGFMKKQFIILAFLIVGASLSYFFLVDRSANVNIFLIIFCVCTLLMGIVISLVNIPLGTVLARQVDKNMLGKVQSLINIGSQGLIPIASVLGGVVIEYIGKPELLFMCSGGFVLITIIFVLNKTVNEL